MHYFVQHNYTTKNKSPTLKAKGEVYVCMEVGEGTGEINDDGEK